MRDKYVIRDWRDRWAMFLGLTVCVIFGHLWKRKFHGFVCRRCGRWTA